MALQEPVENRFYKSLNASTTDQSDYVIPTDRIYYLKKLGANSTSAGSSCRVEIIWDPSGTNEILLSSSADADQESHKELIGDGVKVLRIKLINNDVVSRTIGGYNLGILGG